MTLAKERQIDWFRTDWNISKARNDWPTTYGENGAPRHWHLSKELVVQLLMELLTVDLERGNDFILAQSAEPGVAYIRIIMSGHRIHLAFPIEEFCENVAVAWCRVNGVEIAYTEAEVKS